MNGESQKERDALDRLADAFVDDILNVPDEEILAEIAEDYGDPGKVAQNMRALFERAIHEEGRGRLAAAKQAVIEARKKGGSVVNIDMAEARRRYESMVANDRDLSTKLTLAARKGEGQSERDINSTIKDLAELGALNDDEDEDA